MLDFVIVIILLFGAIRGYIKGFFIQSLTLVALVLGIWTGIKLNSILCEMLVNLFNLKSSFNPYISFAIIFILVIIVIHYLGVFLTKVFDKEVIGSINKILGLIFGIAKFAFLLSVCFFLIHKFDKSGKVITDARKNHSILYLPVSKIAPAIFPHIDYEKVKKGIIG